VDQRRFQGTSGRRCRICTPHREPPYERRDARECRPSSRCAVLDTAHWPTWLLLLGAFAISRRDYRSLATETRLRPRSFPAPIEPAPAARRPPQSRAVLSRTPADERRALLTRHFEAVGMSFVRWASVGSHRSIRLLTPSRSWGASISTAHLAVGKVRCFHRAISPTLEVGVPCSSGWRHGPAACTARSATR